MRQNKALLRFFQTAALVTIGLAALSGCKKKKTKKPLPPGKCRTDKDCPKDKPHCVDGTCKQCKDDSHCAADERCVDGRCLKKCKSDQDCPQGEICKDGVCQTVPCQKDADCGPGRECKNGRCQALAKGSCVVDDDCADEEVCKNGQCVPAPRPTRPPDVCSLSPIYFDFDKSTLTASARKTLQENAECLRKVKDRTVQLEGHCDPRGTEEYNLALSNERAQTVKKYLKRMGIKASRMRVVPKGELEATGTDESSWAKDRRVVFIWY
jgi:peptidoglycan-associated lipoprotein